MVIIGNLCHIKGINIILGLSLLIINRIVKDFFNCVIQCRIGRVCILCDRDRSYYLVLRNHSATVDPCSFSCIRGDISSIELRHIMLDHP